MKNYSFSNIASEESYGIRKSNDFANCYRHSQLKTTEANQRIQEIKKKYDTPSRRERIDSLKKSKDFQLASKGPTREEGKQNYQQHRPAPTFGSNHLKESFAVNRLEKNSFKNEIDTKQFVNLRGQGKDLRQKFDNRQSELASFKTVAREDEQLFSKVREMKESIINNDYMKSSIGGRSSIASSGKYNQIAEARDNKRDFDPRVQNIDKINSKIKQILSCLAQNDKVPSKYIREQNDKPVFKQTASNYPKDNSTPNNYYSKQTTNNFWKDSNPSSYFKERPKTTSSYLRDNKSNYEQEKEFTSGYMKDSKTNSKDSAFFGIKAKDISESGKSYESHFHKNSDVVQKINIYDPKTATTIPDQKETKQIQTTSNIQRNDKYNTDGSSNLTNIQIKKDFQNQLRLKDRDYSVNRIDYIRGDYSISKPINRREEQLSRTPSYLNGKYQQSKIGMKASRSRSQIDSIKKSTFTPNDNVLKSGKKLNDQISKIQRKIEQFESQKRKLNIEFTPFSLKNKSTTNLISVNHKPQRTTDGYNSKDNQEINQTGKSVIDFRGSSNDFRLGLKGLNSEDKSFDSSKRNDQIREANRAYEHSINGPKFSLQQMKYNDFQLKIQQVEVKTGRIQNQGQVPEEMSINNSQVDNNSYKNNIDEAAIRKRCDQGIQERKKRLQGSDDIIKTESLKKLVVLFCEQAKLDQNYRNQKIWLQSCFDKDKFSKLAQLLNKEGINASVKECENMFTVDESEHNPFFSVQGFEGSLTSLVKSYTQAQNNWINKIQQNFDQNSLQSQGFTSSKIDLQKKGFIQLQDLVRFLNIQSGTFYRNRDIFLIFHRFTKSERTSYQQMLRQISA